MDDRQPVGIDRPFGTLGNEVIHQPQEAGGQEETHCVVAIPPLGHGVLHAGHQDVGLVARQRHRHRQIVDDVQHGNCDDEGEIKPVGHIDMRLTALPQGAQEHQQVNHPHDGEPEVDVPLRFRVFLRLGDAKHIAGRRQHDEELIAPEHEPRRDVARQPRLAGALDHVERRGDQDVAAERENHGGGVKRAEASEIEFGNARQQRRIGKLQGDDQTHREADHAPEGGSDDAPPHHGIIVLHPVRRARRRATLQEIEVPVADPHDRQDAEQGDEAAMQHHRPGLRTGNHEETQKGPQNEQANGAPPHGGEPAVIGHRRLW